MYLRLCWRFLFIPVTLDWQVKSLPICSCNRDWLTTHRRSAKHPSSLWLSWTQFTWLSFNTGIILVQQWVGLKLSQWTAYTSKVRQLMVCVTSISTFSRTKTSFLSTRSCKVYTWIVLQTLTQIISVQKKLCPIALAKSAWEFFCGYFLVKGRFWALLEALRIFWGFWFCSHYIIPVTWNQEYTLGLHTVMTPVYGFNVVIYHVLNCL